MVDNKASDLTVDAIMTPASGAHFLGPDRSVEDAEKFIKEKGVRHIPVVDLERSASGEKRQRLVGIVSERDILRALPSAMDAGPRLMNAKRAEAEKERLSKIKRQQLNKIMTFSPKTVTVGTPFGKAVELMLQMKIDSIPVVEGPDSLFRGLLTSSDLLALLVSRFKDRALEQAQTLSPAQVHSLRPVDTAATAMKLLQEKTIRHLPVAQDKVLKGIVTDRDILRQLPAIARSGARPPAAAGDAPFRQELFRIDPEDPESRAVLAQPLSKFMSTKLITSPPTAAAVDLAASMVEHRIGCIPLVLAPKQELVGIVTQTDLLALLGRLGASA